MHPSGSAKFQNPGLTEGTGFGLSKPSACNHQFVNQRRPKASTAACATRSNSSTSLCCNFAPHVGGWHPKEFRLAHSQSRHGSKKSLRTQGSSSMSGFQDSSSNFLGAAYRQRDLVSGSPSTLILRCCSELQSFRVHTCCKSRCFCKALPRLHILQGSSRGFEYCPSQGLPCNMCGLQEFRVQGLGLVVWGRRTSPAPYS